MPPVPWYHTDWLYRIPLTVNKAKVGAVLSDFPVYLPGTHLPASVFAQAQAGGNDLLFTLGDGVTKLSHERVHWAPGSAGLEAHFKAPSLSNVTDTPFYLYFGNRTCGDQQSAAATFAGYRLRLGMGQPTGNLTDSTGTQNGTPQGGLTQGAAGKLYSTGACTFDGSDDYVLLTGLADTGQTYTFSWWYKSTQTAHATANRNLFDTQTGRIIIGLLRASTGVQFVFEAAYRNFSAPPNDGNWHLQHLVLNGAGSAGTLYTDGGSPQNITYAARNIGGAVTLGCHYLAQVDTFIAATVDEFRIRNGILGATWITTEYNNQSDPASFWTVGPVEYVADEAALLRRKAWGWKWR